MALEAAIDAIVETTSVIFTVRVENVGDSPVELRFTSGQTADVAVYEGDSIDGDDPVWQWSDGRMFTQAIRDQTLHPGGEIQEEFTWKNPSPGTYVARGTLEADKSAEAETTFSV